MPSPLQSHPSAEGVRALAGLTLGLLAALGFATMFENSVVIPGVGTVARAFGVTAALAALGAVLAGHEVRQPDTPVVLMTAFVAWAAASALWSSSPGFATERLGTLLQGYVLALLLWTFATTPRARRWLLFAWVGGAGVLSATLLWSGLTDTNLIFDAGYRRLKVFNTDPNESAALLATAIPIAWYLARDVRRRALAAPLALLVPLFATGVLLTGSRGGAVALAAALVCLILAPLRGNRRFTPLLVLATLLALGILAVRTWVPESTLLRLAGLPSDLQTGTWTHRLTIWRAGLESLTDRPLAGIGIGAYADMSLTRTGLYYVAHNTAISVLVEQGLIGFTLFLALIGAVGLRAFRSAPTTRWLLLSMMAVWTVAGMTVSYETAKETWFLVGILVCVHPSESWAQGADTGV